MCVGTVLGRSWDQEACVPMWSAGASCHQRTKRNGLPVGRDSVEYEARHCPLVETDLCFSPCDIRPRPQPSTTTKFKVQLCWGLAAEPVHAHDAGSCSQFLLHPRFALCQVHRPCNSKIPTRRQCMLCLREPFSWHTLRALGL